MAAYGCIWPCAPNTPSPIMVTYGRVHVHGILLLPTILPIPTSNGCRHTYPRNPPNPQKYPLLLSMAVYGHAYESYGRVLDVTPT
eukprot:7517188-Pyramimonas_sp.AAC.1